MVSPKGRAIVPLDRSRTGASYGNPASPNAHRNNSTPDTVTEARFKSLPNLIGSEETKEGVVNKIPIKEGGRKNFFAISPRHDRDITFYEFKLEKGKTKEPLVHSLCRVLRETCRDMTIGAVVGSWGFLVMTALLWTKDLCLIQFWDHTNQQQRLSILLVGIVRGLCLQLWPLGLFKFLLPHQVDRQFLSLNLALVPLDTLYRVLVYACSLGAIEGLPLELPLNFLFIFLVWANCYAMARRLRPDKRAGLTTKFAIPLLTPIFLGAFFGHSILPIYQAQGDGGRQVTIICSIVVLAISRGLCGMVMQSIAQLQASRTFIIMSTIVALNSVLIRTLQAGLGTLSGKVANALILGLIEMTGTLFVPYGDFILYMLKNRTIKIPKGLAIPRRRRVFADVVLMSNKLECSSVALANGAAFLVRTSYGGLRDWGAALRAFVAATALLLVVESLYEYLTYLWLCRVENIPVLRCGKAHPARVLGLLLFVVTMGTLYFSSKVVPIVADAAAVTEWGVCRFCMAAAVCEGAGLAPDLEE